MSLVDGRAPAPGGPEVEREIAFDMLKRGVWFAPVVLLVATMIWGVEGAASAALAIALVSVNLVLAALGLSWAAKRSLNHLMVVSLAGFAVRDADWVNMVALGVCVLVTHLGLLFWELRYVSLSLAFPGLKPTTDKEAVA